MATIRSQMELVDNMSRKLAKITGGLNRMVGTAKMVETAYNRSMASMKSETVINSQQKIINKNIKIKDGIDKNTNSQNRFNDSTRQGANASDGLLRRVQQLAGAYLGLQGAKRALSLSDTLNQNKARLNLVNDGLQTTEQLQNKIFEASKRSRGSYLAMSDTVAKLRLQAKDAFTNNDQAIKFAENINKMFTISGTSIEGAGSTMYNLTQALSSGVLRGQDFNIVMQNAPMILEKVAESMNVPMGKLRELASEGKLSAQVVKSAILNASNDIDAKFSKMPMTWGQLWQRASDGIIIAFQPVLEWLALGASWILENWAMVEPVFVGAGVAIGVFAIGTMIASGALWGAVTATWAWTTALLANPIFWIALAIGIVVFAIYRWIQAVGGIRVAWAISMNFIKSSFDYVKISLFTGVFAILNMFDKLKLGALRVSVGMANAFGSMKVRVLTTIQGLVNGAIDLINSLINAVNKIPGVAISAIEHVTFGTTAQIQFEADKQSRNNMLMAEGKLISKSLQSRADMLNKMKTDAESAKQARLAEIGNLKIANISGGGSALNYGGGMSSGMAGLGGDGAGGGKLGSDVGAIKDSVVKSEEDLKYLRDIAEREVINRFTTAEINVSLGGVTNNVANNTDLDGVISYLEDGLYSAMYSVAEGV